MNSIEILYFWHLKLEINYRRLKKIIIIIIIIIIITIIIIIKIMIFYSSEKVGGRQIKTSTYEQSKQLQIS